MTPSPRLQCKVTCPCCPAYAAYEPVVGGFESAASSSHTCREREGEAEREGEGEGEGEGEREVRVSGVTQAQPASPSHALPPYSYLPASLCRRSSSRQSLAWRGPSKLPSSLSPSLSLSAVDVVDLALYFPARGGVAAVTLAPALAPALALALALALAAYVRAHVYASGRNGGGRAGQERSGAEREQLSIQMLRS